jgi:hypothetical protein
LNLLDRITLCVFDVRHIAIPAWIARTWEPPICPSAFRTKFRITLRVPIPRVSISCAFKLNSTPLGPSPAHLTSPNNHKTGPRESALGWVQLKAIAIVVQTGRATTELLVTYTVVNRVVLVTRFARDVNMTLGNRSEG